MLNREPHNLTLGSSSNFQKKFNLIVLLSALSIIFFVIFSPPMPGVADQGDFGRVINVTGLGDAVIDQSNSEARWFKYVITEYRITPLNFRRLIGILPTTSMIYPIYIARVISKLCGSSFFNTKILAAVYSCFYLVGIYLCLKHMKFKQKSTYIFFTLASLVILLDGGYLIWFNSLYGEPMMFTGLLFFVGTTLYVIESAEQINLKKLMLIFLSSLLFLVAKFQCFSALPIIILMIVRIVYVMHTKKKKAKLLLSLVVFILFTAYYVRGVYIDINRTCGIDTQYNSVFYGILKNTKDPHGDLKKLGLPQDMVLEAGKHAYLPQDQYVKYAPGSQLTLKEFNSNISNFKLLKFYLYNPKRLIEGMEYTATKSFDTMGTLGKYEKSEVPEYTYEFNRFTLWSDFRSTLLPRNLIFILIFYFAVISTSIYEYMKNKRAKLFKLKIELFWSVIAIGLLQFPMPYIGNGTADTSKQLFLFNYTFDIVFLIACTWVLDKVSILIKKLIFSMYSMDFSDQCNNP